jgi:hypothetical protein
MKQILTLFVLTAFLFGCKKSSTEDEYYTLNGIVLDYDSRLPIAGAKVYAGPLCIGGCASDSAVSDAAGRVSFRVMNTAGITILLSASKDNYVKPPIYFFVPINIGERTDTTYLVKPSFVNLTTHKAGTYNPSDSLAIRVMGDINATSVYRDFTREKADATDKTFNLSAWYQSPYNLKLYFQWDIIRGGTVISSKSDSTSLIQYGTKNFTLNY